MKISTPEIKVIRFSSEDVIVASSSLTGVNGLFYSPSSQYSSGYVEFNGTIGSYHSGANGYLIGNIYGETDGKDRDGLVSGGSYTFPDEEVTVPPFVMESIAQQSYDAFSYDGQYYTNGISYYKQYWQ